MGVLTEAVDASLSLQMRALFMFDETVVTVGLVISLAAALVMVGAMAAHDLIKAAQLPIIKLKATKAMPDLALLRRATSGICSCAAVPTNPPLFNTT